MEDGLLEKCNKMWNKDSISIKKEFDSEPIYILGEPAIVVCALRGTLSLTSEFENRFIVRCN